MATSEIIFGELGGGGNKRMALITFYSSYGGAYTLFAPDFSIVKTVKIPYNAASDIDDEYVKITGGRQSDTLTFKKNCTKYYSTDSGQVTTLCYALTETASITAGTVISNVYSNVKGAFYVFD